jgi:hypothetical protein
LGSIFGFIFTFVLYPRTDGSLPTQQTTDFKSNATEACCEKESMRSLFSEKLTAAKISLVSKVNL